MNAKLVVLKGILKWKRFMAKKRGRGQDDRGIPFGSFALQALRHQDQDRQLTHITLFLLDRNQVN